MLIIKKNELKRLIKNNNDIIGRKVEKAGLVNEDISHYISNIINQENKVDMSGPKLFARNPNRNEINEEDEKDIVDDMEYEVMSNDEYEESNEMEIIE
jgi:hypothetical protein